MRTRRAAVAICCALLLAACGEAAPNAQPSSAPGAEPSADTSTAGPSPAASLPASEPGHTAAPASGLDGATLYGVAGSDSGLVAVGSADGFAAAWTSTDAGTWQPATVEQDGGPPQFRGVAADPDGGLVAFSGADDEASGVWTSDDGTAWAGIDASGIDGRINAVTFSDGRWLAVGDLIDAEGFATSGVLYSSADARSWKVETDELTGTELTVSDVVVSAVGTVVVGFDAAGGAVWLDPAGSSEQITDGFGAATVQGVAATDDGLVALGRSIAGLQPLAWMSADAGAWQRAELDAEVFGPDDQIHDLTAAAGELIAVGASPAGGAVWTSTDGQTWQRAP
ncbi:hypothetical protein BH23ACT10_BH23ACT10_05890 [soil metagenome]